MPAGEYSLRLQNGIQGGFIPAIPNAIYTLTQPANSDQLHITSAERKDGTPDLCDLAPKYINSKDQTTTALVDELEAILKKLPTEQPPGSEDIYGLDISIAYGADGFEWMNGAPQGCGGGESYVKATDEEKAQFKRAVEIVNNLVAKTE